MRIESYHCTHPRGSISYRLAKDQSEINKIITEASKGSKFYDNEKAKDKALTERIDRILKQKDEALKSVKDMRAKHCNYAYPSIL